MNVRRSSNSGIDRIVLDDRWEGERFPLFQLLRDPRIGAGAGRRGRAGADRRVESGCPVARESGSGGGPRLGCGGGAGRGCHYAQSGEHRDLANQVNVRKSNQVNIGAFRGSFLEPAPRSSRAKPPDVVSGVSCTATRGVAGWRGRIRTFDLLIQSQAPYRLATRQWSVRDDTAAQSRTGIAVHHATWRRRPVSTS